MNLLIFFESDWLYVKQTPWVSVSRRIQISLFIFCSSCSWVMFLCGRSAFLWTRFWCKWVHQSVYLATILSLLHIKNCSCNANPFFSSQFECWRCLATCCISLRPRRRIGPGSFRRSKAKYPPYESWRMVHHLSWNKNWCLLFVIGFGRSPRQWVLSFVELDPESDSVNLFFY